MKLTYHTALFILCLVVVSACYKDKGVYTYKDKEEITITGIEGAYTKISFFDKIVADPQVTSTDPEADFSYFWGIYETNVQGSVPKIDTISKQKALDYMVAKPAKTWVLVFGVTNKHTGYGKIVTSSVNVITEFTRGWYVIKDDGTNTDVDMFLTPNSHFPADAKAPRDNVFSLVNERNMPGKARKISFCTNYKTTVNGTTYANTRTMFLLSENDAVAVNMSTFKVINPFENLYYAVPAVKAPSYVGEAAQANYLVNDGKLHSIYNMSLNVGKFGAVIMRDDVNTSYHLSKHALTYSAWNPFFYDEMSSSFVSATGTASTMSKVGDVTGSEMPAEHTNKTLLFMGSRHFNPFAGYALFQDKTDPSLKILSSIVPSGFNLKIDNDTLAPAEKLYNAEKCALNFQDESILYFNVGREIWSRNLVNRAEALQFTVPAGEEVAFISHRKYSSETAYAYNYIMIATNVSGKYKVRMFKKTSGNLAAEPDFVLEGNGNVADVMYITPSVSGTTYANQ